MSMPSSSALVATTPSSEPSLSAALDPAAILGRVAGAVGGQPPRLRRLVALEPLARVLVDQLAARAALGKDDRAHLACDQPRQERRGLAQRACPHPEQLVEERGVPDGDLALGRRRAVVIDHRHRPPASRPAASPGLAMVAEAIANFGLAPYMRQSRRRRAITFTTWAPNTPR